MVLAIVKSADNSLMSQKFEIILKTVYSDRIGRNIAETNIRNFADFQRRSLSIYYYRVIQIFIIS